MSRQSNIKKSRALLEPIAAKHNVPYKRVLTYAIFIRRVLKKAFPGHWYIGPVVAALANEALTTNSDPRDEADLYVRRREIDTVLKELAATARPEFITTDTKEFFERE